MRKFKLLLLGLSMAVFVNCGGDDENEFLAPLAGTWNISKLTSSGCNDSAEDGELTCTGTSCFVLTINSNGTYTLVDNTEQPATTDSGTIDATATTVTLCETGDTDCTPDSYTIVDGNLSVKFSDEDSPGCEFTAVGTKQ
jgi:hypothetical protein